ncbi:hypothetical protein HDV05_007561, partial [Chytridiales sp. JEL 0842]
MDIPRPVFQGLPAGAPPIPPPIAAAAVPTDDAASAAIDYALDVDHRHRLAQATPSDRAGSLDYLYAVSKGVQRNLRRRDYKVVPGETERARRSSHRRPTYFQPIHNITHLTRMRASPVRQYLQFYGIDLQGVGLPELNKNPLLKTKRRRNEDEWLGLTARGTGFKRLPRMAPR